MEQKNGPSIVKWLVIGFLGSLALIFTFVIILVFIFSPVIRIDEPKGKVVVLGGLIEVTGKKKDAEVTASLPELSQNLEVDLGGQHVNALSFMFNVGELSIKTSKDNFLRINCENPLPLQSKIEKEQFLLDLSGAASVKCAVSIPEKVSSFIKGVSGKVVIEGPRFDLQVKMVNAKMSFAPADGVDYKFSNSVAYGAMDQFNSSEKKDAYKISLSLVNGALTKGTP